MKKRMVAMLLCLMMVLMALPVVTYADSTGVVLANYVSVRQSPDESSKRLYKATSSKELVIVGQIGEWYVVDLMASSFSTEGGIGYVKSVYIATTGYWLKLNRNSVKFYNDPWSGLANGERGSSDIIFVTYETSEWLVVKTNNESAGSSFVKKADVGLYDYVTGSYYPYANSYPNGYIGAPGTTSNRWMVMYDSDGVSVGIRERTNLQGEMLEVIHSGDVVTVLENQGEYAYVVYTNPKGQNVYGWVRTKYFIPAP